MRTTLIGGEKKMLVWNDLEADEKIKIYDKGVDVKNHESVYDLLVSYRSGDMWAPKVEQIEALKLETQVFHRLHQERQDALQRRAGRPAGGQDARGLQPVAEERREDGPPMNDYLCIAPDVKLGNDVKLSKFINLYGCTVGDETKIGAFVEVQKNASIGSNCKIPSHTFICEGVTIEDNVFIGHSVSSSTTTTPARPPPAAACRPKRTGRSSPRWSRRAPPSARAPQSSATSPSARTPSSGPAAW